MLVAGARADRWGRKPLFLAGFLYFTLAAVSFYTLSDNQFWLVAVQTFSMASARLFGALFPGLSWPT